jgi:predicted metal-dependent RNase
LKNKWRQRRTTPFFSLSFLFKIENWRWQKKRTDSFVQATTSNTKGELSSVPFSSLRPSCSNFTHTLARTKPTTTMTIQIVPLGAGQDVGRSCILVTIGGKNIMLDCGMHMGFNGTSHCQVTPAQFLRQW